MPRGCRRGRRCPRQGPGCRSGNGWPGNGSHCRSCCTDADVRIDQLQSLLVNYSRRVEWKQERTIAAGAHVIPMVVMVCHVEMSKVLVPVVVAVTDKR